MSRLLPPEFADLEPFAEKWCLETEAARFAQRMASPMQELVEFHDAFLPRLDAAIDHCDGFPLDDLPPDVGRLLQLVYSLVMVSMAVEIFHQPRTVDAADAVLVRTGEPLP